MSTHCSARKSSANTRRGPAGFKVSEDLHQVLELLGAPAPRPGHAREEVLHQAPVRKPQNPVDPKPLRPDGRLHRFGFCPPLTPRKPRRARR